MLDVLGQSHIDPFDIILMALGDRIRTALHTYGCMVCSLSTLYLFWVYLLEGNLSRRYASSRRYHWRLRLLLPPSFSEFTF